MKKLIVLFTSLLLAWMCVLAPSTHAAQAGTARASLYIDGKPAAFQTFAYRGIKENMVSLRTAAAALKLVLTYVPASKEWQAADASHDIRVKVNSATARVNSQPKAMNVPAQIVNGTLFVPLRFIVEADGGTIQAESTKSESVYWALSGHQKALSTAVILDQIDEVQAMLHDWHELTIPMGLDGVKPYDLVKSVAMLRLFLQAGFPIDYQLKNYGGSVYFESGYTLLHQAASLGRFELVEYLLGQGANANLLALDSKPLELAVENRDRIQKGYPNFEGIDQETALANYDKTIELLRKYTKFDLYFKDNKGNILAEDEDIVPDSVTVQQALGDPSGNGYQISMTFKDPAKLESITAAHVGETIGIYLNEKLLVDPMVSAPIKGGSLAISGQFTEEEANAFIEDPKQAMA